MPSTQRIDEVWREMPSLLDRLLAAPQATRANHPPVPKRPGIYLFSEDGRYRYVGQTRNLRDRLGQHTRPSGDRYNATLAFRLAIEEAGETGIDTSGTRSGLERSPAFIPIFAEVKSRVANWPVQFIEVDDPIVRTLLEVYVHVSLGTDLNTFETH
jgi:hypothetical protein